MEGTEAPKKKGGGKPRDPEIKALDRVRGVLKSINVEQRSRVLSFVMSEHTQERAQAEELERKAYLSAMNHGLAGGLAATGVAAR